ncbi:hypothetical protein [Salinifilum ghardaiensis]
MRNNGQDVHKTAQRIDRSMWSVNKIVRRFGAPKGVSHELTATKKAVGNVIAKMEMIERRQ